MDYLLILHPKLIKNFRLLLKINNCWRNESGYESSRTEISAGKGGDICGQGRRYLRIKAEISARKAARLSDKIKRILI